MIDQKLHVSVNQVEYHPFLNQEDLLSFCEKNSIAITAYCPLARGLVFKDPDIKNLAKKYNKSPGQISLRWLIQKDLIAIPKATSKEHLKENFDIFDFEISKEDMSKIDNIGKVTRKRIIDPEFSDFEY
jgi:diketogulonate reductase-like aldo/keto reductase